MKPRKGAIAGVAVEGRESGYEARSVCEKYLHRVMSDGRGFDLIDKSDCNFS
ncbi:hypothetical protein [Bauldia litoralis]|uniref:Uncharacterized protein n=1 Tax=Bauldia litoralis TaxID=665467 RepID=A0A1G6EM35_9HYPH|nr:hypothetical protein [Bauldia litoralis]SDB58477.1 hypothetical protein SAMN02982931_04692 [Bauldia litoralis]